MLNLTGYQEIEQLYVGNRTLVYRAMREKDRQPAIVKVLRNPHPNFNELLQFRNQYAIARHLDSPYIIQPIAPEGYGNGYAANSAFSDENYGLSLFLSAYQFG